MLKKVNLRDIAANADVSVATASRVLRGSSQVRPELRARVISSAQKLGLNLNEGPRAKTAGFLLCNRRILHAFHSRVLLGAEEYFASYDYNLMFLSLRFDARVDLHDLHMPRILQARDLVCGYILEGRISPNVLEYMRGKEIPLAVLGNHVSGKWQDELFDVVWFDDIQGTYEATRYLLSLGHRHIWFAGNCRLSWAARRYQGYTRAMTEAGLHPQLSELDSDDYFELGYLSTKSIMSRGNLLTAIVAGSDEIAQGAYSALRDCGLEIPRDVSVAGFDDIGAALLHPPLTTVSGFPDRVGNQLAQILLERIAHPDLPPQHRIIPTRLVKRESHRSLAPESVKESEAHGQGASMISDGASSQTSQVA